MEKVEIEDVEEGYSSNDIPFLKSDTKRSEHEMSDTVQAILRTSKQERDALFSTRKKLGDVLGFLQKKGFTEEQVLSGLKADGFGSAQPNKDEHDLPIGNSVQNPFRDKMKQKIDDESSNAYKVFDKSPNLQKGKLDTEQEMSEETSPKDLNTPLEHLEKSEEAKTG